MPKKQLSSNMDADAFGMKSAGGGEEDGYKTKKTSKTWLSKKKKEQLDDLGEAWKAEKKQGNTAAAKTIEEKVFVVLLSGSVRDVWVQKTKKRLNLSLQDVEDKYFECVCDLFSQMVKTQKEESLCLFLNYRLKYAAKDLIRAQKKRDERISQDSYDEAEQLDEDEGGLISRSVAQINKQNGFFSPVEEAIKRREDNRALYNFFCLMLEHLHVSCKSTKIRTQDAVFFYKVFFSGTMLVASRVYQNCFLLFMNQKSQLAFEVMRLEYLDFILQKCCRSAAEIIYTPYRPFNEICEGKNEPKDMERIPMKQYIFMSFFRRVDSLQCAQSTMSKRLTNYRNYFKNTYDEVEGGNKESTMFSLFR